MNRQVKYNKAQTLTLLSCILKRERREKGGGGTSPASLCVLHIKYYLCQGNWEEENRVGVHLMVSGDIPDAVNWAISSKSTETMR